MILKASTCMHGTTHWTKAGCILFIALLQHMYQWNTTFHWKLCNNWWNLHSAYNDCITAGKWWHNISLLWGMKVLQKYYSLEPLTSGAKVATTLHYSICTCLVFHSINFLFNISYILSNFKHIIKFAMLANQNVMLTWSLGNVLGGSWVTWIINPS